MHFDGTLRYLFSVDPTEAFEEALSGFQRLATISVVPGFSNDRGLISLRGPVKKPKNDVFFDEDLIQCVDRIQAKYFPKLVQLTDQIVREAGASQVGMVTVAVMKPGAIVHPHVDLGPYYQHYRRLHVALGSFPGATLKAGDTEIHVDSGEVWELNNVIYHSAKNSGTVDRYHLIIDLT
jgi:hypothetical protein